MSGEHIIQSGAYGQPISVKTPSQARIVHALNNSDVVFCMGPAGTGKTYIAIALACKALLEGNAKQIVITRPAIEAGENLGFLPGSLYEKIDPYLQPIFAIFREILGNGKFDSLRGDQTIEIVPLAYMRGRTFKNAYIIADEMQNATYAQLKMLLTRLGRRSKLIVNGDPSQTDLPHARHSSLRSAAEVLHRVNGIKFVDLDGEDVLRHGIVGNIIKAYDEFETANERKHSMYTNGTREKHGEFQLDIP